MGLVYELRPPTGKTLAVEGSAVEQLELSLIGYEPRHHESVLAFLKRFDRPCQMQRMVWEEAWEKLARIALYQSGPDVSQVGTTWLGTFSATGAVRPFTRREIEDMGGQSVFLPASWETVCSQPRKDRVWALPWLSDVRVVFYWRDMLEEAGIDEQTAFQTPQQVEETMERLQASRIATPWGIWAGGWHNVNLQNAATWVWGAGGDFISADGKDILFDRPEAQRGLATYLKLHRFLPPGSTRIEPIDFVQPFVERRVALTMTLCGQLSRIYEQSAVRDVRDRLGVAAPPGPAFVGGSNLIVWQYTRHAQDALDLVRFLASPEIQTECCLLMDCLPVRIDVLAAPPFTTDPHYHMMVEALRSGRSFPVFPKWGLAEEKLVEALLRLWNSVLADPTQEVEALVESHVSSLAQRLAVTLGTRV